MGPDRKKKYVRGTRYFVLFVDVVVDSMHIIVMRLLKQQASVKYSTFRHSFVLFLHFAYMPLLCLTKTDQTMKLTEPGRHKLARQNFRQQLKQATLCSDLCYEGERWKGSEH